MSWQPEVEEMHRRKAMAKELGGAEAVRRFKSSGRHTVRERIEMLVDAGSFTEMGMLTGKAQYAEDGSLEGVTPSNAIIGKALIHGRKTSISADDYTIRGGSSESTISEKWIFAERYAYEMQMPLVRLVDTAGGSVRLLEINQSTKIPGYATWPRGKLLGLVPVVGIGLGACAGLGAVKVVLSHFSILVEGQGQVFAAGPPVVEPGLGEKTSKEDLGGVQVHVHGSGVVDNAAASEEEAFALARRFLSYMPQNVYELPPEVPSDDPPDRREEALLSIVPREKRRVYKMRRVLELIFDRDSLFEMSPHNGASTITCLGRLRGRVVGIMANDPYQYGGAMTRTTAQKVETFIDLCDTFHIPIVNFTDQPGLMVGLDAEKSGTLRAAARTLAAIEQSQVPWCTIVVRRAFGVGGGAHGRLQGINLRYAWPSGYWGSIPLEGGIAAAYRRDIAAAPDPAARLAELEQYYTKYTSPFRTAERFNMLDIIDPRDTRPILCDWSEEAYAVLPRQLGPIGRTMRR